MSKVIIIELDEDFSEIGVCSQISYNTLKTILEGVNCCFDKSKMKTKITGFIITEKGIQIQKKYIKEEYGYRTIIR